MAAWEEPVMAPFINFLGLGTAIAGAVVLEAGLQAKDYPTVGVALVVIVIGVVVVCRRWEQP
jgi:hypothetical protein